MRPLPGIIIFLLFILAGCSGLSKNPIQSIEQKENENLYYRLKTEGDREFGKMHWTGWSRAADLYRKALAIRESEKIREKLFFAHLHKAVRARFFFLPGKVHLDHAEDQLPHLEHRSDILRLYVRVAQIFLLQEDTGAFSPAELSALKQDGDTDYKYMFYILYQSAKMEHREYRKEAEVMLTRFPDSNLRFFLRDKYMGIDQAIQDHPDYIELLVTRADLYFNTGKLSKAEKMYLKVLEIDDTIATALTELGNIHNREEFYSEALEYFERAIRISPLYYKSLFGKAVCLSQTGRYRESIAVLDTMIKNDLWYKGEVYYYRAFNHFILKEFEQIEPDLQQSELYIPDSVELHTLAGMYYYEMKKYGKSRKSFNRATGLNKEYPRPFYYLGFLDIEDKNIPSSIRNFKTAAANYLMMIKKNIEGLDALEKKDLPEKRKRKILQKRIRRIHAKIDEIIEKLSKVSAMLSRLPREKTVFLPQTIQKLKQRKSLLANQI